MKVYAVLCEQDYGVGQPDDVDVAGVFATREDADAYRRRLHDSLYAYHDVKDFLVTVSEHELEGGSDD